MSALLDRAVAGADQTAVVLCVSGAVTRVGELVREHVGERAVIVADENTLAAAGEQVRAGLEQAGVHLEETIVLPGDPVVHADQDALDHVREALTGVGVQGGAQGDSDAVVPVAVGSGVLNDLVKRACGELQVPYAVVATAASMDGYTGFGASIAVDGVKTTLPCPAPRVAVLDPQIATGAPAIMVASGYGDLLGKVPAGADWILADVVGVEAIDTAVWELVQGPLHQALADPAALAAGDEDAHLALLEGLAMSGLAMQVYDGTRPASGAEHYFSHCWEMEGLGADRVPPLSHGEKVGIGSIAVAAFYERVLLRDLRDLDVEAAVAAYPAWEDLEAQVRESFAAYPASLQDAAVAQTKEKHLDEEGLRAHLVALQEAWGSVVPRLREQLLNAQELSDRLAAVGGPSTPEQIGLSRERLRLTYQQARMFRSRWTVLDLAFEAGWLEEIVDELFAEGGFWHQG